MLDQKLKILDNLEKDYVIPVLVWGFLFSYDFLTTEKVIKLNMATLCATKMFVKCWMLCVKLPFMRSLNSVFIYDKNIV